MNSSDANLIKIDQLSRQNTTSSHTSASITNFKGNKNNFLRISGIVTSSVLSFFILLTVIFYFVFGSTRNYQIITFQFTHGYTPFETHQVSLIIYLILIFGFYSIITYILITQKDKEFMEIFQKERFNKQFSLINLFLISVLFLGVISVKTLLTSILILSFFLASTIFLVVLYRNLKNKKKLSLPALFGLSIFLSVLLAFNTYSILYIIADLITLNYGQAYVMDNLKEFFSIFINVIYACIAIVLLSVYKDIIFSFCLLLIEIGFIANSYKLVTSEIITGSFIISFVLVSIIITVIKYKKAVFGFEENDAWIRDLENDWKENSSNCNNDKN